MQNQACLDGFSQAHLVGQQRPGAMARSDFIRDEKLMWEQSHPSSKKAPNVRPPDLVKQRPRGLS